MMLSKALTVLITLGTTCQIAADEPSTSSQRQSLMACASITSSENRLVCYDRLVRSLEETPIQTINSAASESAPLFGKSDADVRKSLNLKKQSQLAAEVSKVSRSNYKKLHLTLANGQMWQQLDGHYLTIKPGDRVIIRRALAGSYLLSKEAGSRSIRVRRTDSGT